MNGAGIHASADGNHAVGLLEKPHHRARGKLTGDSGVVLGLAEHPFGTIKHAMNQGYFLTRGLPKVRTEMSLTVLAYNLKRAINTRSVGVPQLIQALV